VWVWFVVWINIHEIIEKSSLAFHLAPVCFSIVKTYRNPSQVKSHLFKTKSTVYAEAFLYTFQCWNNGSIGSLASKNVNNNIRRINDFIQFNPNSTEIDQHTFINSLVIHLQINFKMFAFNLESFFLPVYVFVADTFVKVWYISVLWSFALGFWTECLVEKDLQSVNKFIRR
jgi:hypothetical protein